MVRQQRSKAGSAFLWGVTMGILVVLAVVLDRLLFGGLVRRALDERVGGGRLLGLSLSLLAALALYFVAGMLAARRARAVEAGIFAGLIAGAVAGLAGVALALLAVLAIRNGAVVQLPARRGVLVAIVASGLLNLLGSLLAGTALGALGGLLGRGRARPTIPPSQTPPYPLGGGFASEAEPTRPPSGVYPPGAALSPDTPPR